MEKEPKPKELEKLIKAKEQLAEEYGKDSESYKVNILGEFPSPIEDKTTKIKAYEVRDTGRDPEESVIVFAESTSKAKSIGYNLLIWNDNYTDLRVCRCKEADCLYEKWKGNLWAGGRHIDCSQSEGQADYRNLGWKQEDSIQCESCGKFSWDKVPESWVEQGICRECDSNGK